MSEEQYFEQFVGDEIEMIEIICIPMPLKDFNRLDGLSRAQVIAIAKSFMIPMSVWIGQQNG